MQRSNRLLVLIRESDASMVSSRIAAQACLKWQDQIEIRAIEEVSSTANSSFVQRLEENTDKILDEWNNGEFSSAIIMSKTLVGAVTLKNAGVPISTVNSSLVAIKKIIGELKDRKLHWLTHSKSQFEKSSIQHFDPEAWREQFVKLGCGWVGEGLLKLIRVISDNELRSSFKVPSSETIGFQVVHGYFIDHEPGSSSLNIQSILEHLYKAEDIVKINLESSVDFISSSGKNVIYLYEDGLWSGVELVKRLNSLNQKTDLKNIKLQLHFRYGATSDAGLTAGRMFLAREGLTNIHIQPCGEGYHFTLLKSESLPNLQSYGSKFDNEVRSAIDSAVDPFAFQSDEVWLGRKEEAKSICFEIGKQLVPAYLTRKEQEKRQSTSQAKHNDTAVNPLDDSIHKLALGASNYASTIVFSSSIPKPVMPLIWLDGEVEINNRKIRWRPLFWDARMTGSPPN